MKTLISAALLAAFGITLVGCSSEVQSANTSSDGGRAVIAETGESQAYLHSFNLPSHGVALEGYCPVAYFAVNRPVRGKPEHSSTHNDVTYYFVSDEAKEEFDRYPEQYLPAYGGWCAFGMAVEDKFPVDPTNFKIVDGRLMLFLRNPNIDALALWNDGDEGELIARAETHWNAVSE